MIIKAPDGGNGMKMIKSCVIAALLMPAYALAMGPTAQPQCAQVICLSPADGRPAPSECRPIRQVYFNIRVFNPSYDPASTSRLRHRYISMCRTARPADLQKITGKYGVLFNDPISF